MPPEREVPEPSTSSPANKLTSASMRADLMAQIRGLAESFDAKPEIFKRRRLGEPDVATALGVSVPDWKELQQRRDMDLLQAYNSAGGVVLQPFVPTSSALPAAAAVAAAEAALPAAAAAAAAAAPAVALADMPAMRPARAPAKVTKGNKHKGPGGRTYTSKFRGVHQTFPTRRWEAQFRRNGKPTSLGCFDHEEQAARAYDKMMLWCELHGASGVKGGITNFDASEYENDLAWLQTVTQDELVQILRSDGRRQAAQRMMKQKREGQSYADSD